MPILPLQTKAHPLLGVTYDEVVSDASAFVSFTYNTNFAHIISALELLIANPKEENVTENTHFWFDMLVNDQWHALSHDFDWWSTTFSSAIANIGHTVVIFEPWEDPSCLKRVWCLYELKCSTNLSIALSAHEVDSFREMLRYNTTHITRSISQIDAEKAEAYLKEDKDRIFGELVFYSMHNLSIAFSI